MKLLRLTITSFLILLFIFSCGTNTPGPEEIAEQYLYHLNNKEFDKAKELCTEQSREMLEKFEALGDINSEAEIGKTLIENIQCIVNGDRAVCTFTADGEEKEMLLVKVDGKWLIDFEAN